MESSLPKSWTEIEEIRKGQGESLTMDKFAEIGGRSALAMLCAPAGNRQMMSEITRFQAPSLAQMCSRN